MWSEEDTRIYSYPTPAGTRHADPLALQRRLVQLAGGDLDGLVERASADVTPRHAEQADPEAAAPLTAEQAAAEAAMAQAVRRSNVLAAMEAQSQLLGVIREAFALPPVDPVSGEGCPEGACWSVWDHFQGWLAGNAKRAG